MRSIYCYDIETYKNLLSFVFMRIGESPEEDEREKLLEFVSFGDRDDRGEMAEWLREERPILVGYNNAAFDDLILAGTLLFPGKPIRAYWDLAQKLIRKEYSEIGSYGQLREARKSFESIDLMLLTGNKYNSLKELEAKLGLSIQELPFPFDKEITPEELPRLLAYNRHDVKATAALYWELLPVIRTRREIGETFGIHALDSTDSSLANDILNKLYSRPNGADGTPREEIKIADLIWHKIAFESPELQGLLDDLRGTVLTAANEYRYSKAIAFGGNDYRLGIGGLHSEDAPGIFELGERILRDADVTSYYPSIMLELGIYPAHLGSGFLDFFRGIVEKRIEAKERGDSITAGALKIAINSVFGKLKYPYFWLYDPKAFLSVTVNGQLSLLMLIERLEAAGIRVLSANTDGILSAIPPELQERYSAVCGEWEKLTGFSLEYSDYLRYIRKDVNNYLAQGVSGKIKAKGIFVEKRPLSDSYRAPVIARAIRAYFLEGTPLEDTFAAESSLMGFGYVFKPGGKFEMALDLPDGSRLPAPKVNRFYIARSGGNLVKVSRNRTDRVRTNPIVLFNDEVPEKIPDDLDLAFYTAEARKVIDAIENPEGIPEGYSSSLPLLDAAEKRSKAKKSSGSPSGPPLFDSRYSAIEIAEGMKAISEGNSFRAPCPVHDGKDARSLIFSEEGGKLRLHCFGGCKPEEVLREIEKRLDSSEEFRTPEPEPLGEIAAVYDYKDEFGRMLFRKVRYIPKTFRIESYERTGDKFISGKGGARAVLYRLPEVIGSEKVIVCEGEKDADNGRGLGLEGFAFTTNFEGAGTWIDSYSQALAGKDVIVIPDNDPPGLEHARKVANSAAPFARSVTLVTLPEGGDLSDWIELGNGAAELERLIESGDPVKPGALFEESDLLQYPPGDPGNAQAVIRLFGDRIAFTTGFGPMFYDRGYWEMGDAAEALINRKIEASLWRRREAAIKTNDQRYEKIIDLSFPSTARINATRKMLSNYTFVTESEVNTRFVNSPGLLNCVNGVLDLRTGALFPASPNYGFTHRLTAEYNPGVTSAAWLKFLEETIPNKEEREYLQELIGYIFTGEAREEIAIYIFGPTRSGKGTFTETLQYLGGPLAKEINIRTLIDSRSGSDQNFDLAGLYGVRLVHASESKDTDWLDSAKLKAFTGGNWIRAAFKGKNMFEYRPNFTVILTSNESPKMKAEDSAAWYRLRAIQFPISKAGAENKNLKAILREPENITGVLSWVVEGALRWYKRPNGLVTPSSILERTKGFREALDYIMEYLSDYYEIADDLENWDALKEGGFYTSLEDLYSGYKSWHDSAGAPELSKIGFARKIRSRLGGANMFENQCRASVSDKVTGQSKQVRVIAGVRLKRGAVPPSPSPNGSGPVYLSPEEIADKIPF